MSIGIYIFFWCTAGLNQHVFPYTIGLIVCPNFSDIQCRSIHAYSNGVGVLEITPMSNYCLWTWIQREAPNWQHWGWSINCIDIIPISCNSEHSPKIWLLDCCCGLSLSLRWLETSPVDFFQRLIFRYEEKKHKQ